MGSLCAKMRAKNSHAWAPLKDWQQKMCFTYSKDFENGLCMSILSWQTALI
jgi:hypothetical protein